MRHPSHCITYKRGIVTQGNLSGLMAAASILRPLSGHMSTARKDTYKAPPTAITDKFTSQQARRTKVFTCMIAYRPLRFPILINTAPLRFEGSRRPETCAPSQISTLSQNVTYLLTCTSATRTACRLFTPTRFIRRS